MIFLSFWIFLVRTGAQRGCLVCASGCGQSHLEDEEAEGTTGISLWPLHVTTAQLLFGNIQMHTNEGLMEWCEAIRPSVAPPVKLHSATSSVLVAAVVAHFLPISREDNLDPIVGVRVAMPHFKNMWLLHAGTLGLWKSDLENVCLSITQS